MMEDVRYAPQPLAKWYWVAATLSLLFMALGCWGYIMTVTADLATLPPDQRNLIEAQPTWMIAAYAIAVWVGLAGALMLLLRRRLAVPLLLVSLVCAVGTFLPYAIVPAMRDLVTTNDIAVAIVVVLITGTIFSFARHSKQRGWLR
jgi:hypothetical protein